MTTLLSSKQTAEIIGVKIQTLRVWRMRGCGPRYVRFGGSKGRVVYDPVDVTAWIEGRKAGSTSEETVRQEAAGAGVPHAKA